MKFLEWEKGLGKSFCSIDPVTGLMIAGGAQAGGSIFSGIMGSNASKKQAEAIKYAADQARKTALELDDKARADVAPFRQYGIDAGDRLSGILKGDINLDDAVMGGSLFKWQRDEGERALNRQLSARGLYGSGAGLETLARFNAQLVGEESMRHIERLMSMTQLGGNAASHMATNTSTTGRSLADMTMKAGMAIGQAEGDSLRSIGSIGPALGKTVAGGFSDYLQLPLLNANIAAMNRYGGGGSPRLADVVPNANLYGYPSGIGMSRPPASLTATDVTDYSLTGGD
jgi:hypothetical protein